MIELNISIGTIALVCMAMVFLILFFLMTMYHFIPKILDIYFKRKLEKEGKIKSDEYEKRPPVEANVNAAIAMAIHLYTADLHDEESNVITIEDVRKVYSPWRSKIYGVMNDPRR